MSVAVAEAAPKGDQLAVGGELLDPRRARLPDVDEAVGVHGDPGGLEELSRLRARASPASELLAIGGELEQTAAVELRQIDVAVGSDVEVIGGVEEDPKVDLDDVEQRRVARDLRLLLLRLIRLRFSHVRWLCLVRWLRLVSLAGLGGRGSGAVRFIAGASAGGCDQCHERQQPDDRSRAPRTTQSERPKSLSHRSPPAHQPRPARPDRARLRIILAQGGEDGNGHGQLR